MISYYPTTRKITCPTCGMVHPFKLLWRTDKQKQLRCETCGKTFTITLINGRWTQ